MFAILIRKGCIYVQKIYFIHLYYFKCIRAINIHFLHLLHKQLLYSIHHYLAKIFFTANFIPRNTIYTKSFLKIHVQGQCQIKSISMKINCKYNYNCNNMQILFSNLSVNNLCNKTNFLF